MPVDLDTQIRALGLPVQLGVADGEQVESSHNFLGWNAHQADLCGVAANFGSPEAQQLLVSLDTFTLR